MNYTEFENYKNDSSSHLQAIAELLPHLDDHLLLIDEHEFYQISPCRLVTFTASGQALYAIVSDSGRVIVGKTDDMGVNISLELHDFDSSCCEIVTLTISEQQSFFSNDISLWVCVDRYPDDGKPKESLLYHARIGVDNNGSLLFKAVRDVLSITGDNWIGQLILKDKKPPKFLNFWNFTSGYGQDPFKMPETIETKLEKLPAYNAISWYDYNLCYAIANRLYLESSLGTFPIKILKTPTERVNCLALKKPKGSKNLQGIAGCKDYRLIGFEYDEATKKLKEKWRQLLQDNPVAVCFVNDDPENCKLLVLFSDGYLRSFRHIKDIAVSELWQQCWQTVGCSNNLDLEGFLPKGKLLIEQNSKIQEAFHYELLSRLFNPDLSPEQRDHGLQIIDQGRLFAKADEDDNLHPKCMVLLKEQLIAFAGTEEHRLPLSNGNDLLPRLLTILYKQLSLDDQQSLYKQLRYLNFEQIAVDEPAVSELKKIALMSVAKLWLPKQPPKDLQQRLRYADIAIEYWANLFLPSDGVLFKQPKNEHSIVGILGIEQGQQTFFLVVTSQTVKLYPLESGKDHDKAVAEYSLPDNSKHEFVQVVRLYKHGQTGFLLLDNMGSLWVFLLDETINTQSLESPNHYEFNENSFWWRMTSCPSIDGKTSMIAVVATKGRKAFVQFYQLEGKELKECKPEPQKLDIPWITCLDLSVNNTGYRLMAASDQSQLSALFFIDSSFNIKPERQYRLLRSGILSVCFEKKINPDYVLCSGYSGMLWCTEIADLSINLCWSYQLTGFVSAIEPIKLNNKTHFLVSSGAGELFLLDAKTGLRTWQEVLDSSIYQLAVINHPQEKQRLALILEHGKLKLFDEVSTEEHDTAFERIQNCLQRLKQEDFSLDTDNNPMETQCIKTLHSLVNRGQTAKHIFANLSGRKVRGRILMYLVKNTLLEAHIDMLPHLTIRELGLSLTYSDNPNPVWRKRVVQELRKRDNHAPLQHASIDHKRTLVIGLHDLAQQQLDLSSLYEQRPPPVFLEKSIWLRMEYARLLIVAGFAEKTDRQSLLSSLLPYLLNLSPRLIYRLRISFPHQSLDNIDFKALNHLLSKPNLSEQTLEILGNSLKQHKADDKLALLLFSLLEFHHCLSENAEADWIEYRNMALENLQDLITAVQNCHDLDTALKQKFIGVLQQVLPKTSVPADTIALKQRSDWVAQARNTLASYQISKPPPDENSWEAYAHKLLVKTIDRLNEVLADENRYLLQLVRPFVRLANRQTTVGNKIKLEFMLTAEGSQALKNVSIMLDASGKNGLLPAGKLSERLHYAHFPFHGFSENLELEGFVQSGQQEVSVLCSIRDESGYRDETRWNFDLGLSNRPELNKHTLVSLLPDLYFAFREQVFNSTQAVTLVVCDTLLGYEQLIIDWDKKFPGQRVNLDDKSQDIGTGRKLSARQLDFSFIEQELQNAKHQALVLLAPVEELAQRLLAENNARDLRLWCQKLTDRNAMGEQPRFILLVTSLTASELRCHGLQVIEIRAHHLLLPERAQKNPKTDFYPKLLTVMGMDFGIDKLRANRLCQQFGYDLRLILYYLQEFKLVGNRIEVKDILNNLSIKEIIRKELQTLPALDVIRLLAGCTTDSQLKRQEVQAGMIAGEDYYSTTHKNDPKKLQKQGEAFTKLSLRQLDSDARPPANLIVQGYGETGSVIQQESQLFKLCKHFTQPEPESLQSLADRGYGSYIGEVFRTNPPYRDIIKQLYEQFGSKQSGQRDNEVYQSLVGEGHSPIELISSELLSGFSNEGLQNLMPKAIEEDIKILRKIAAFWQLEHAPAQLLIDELRKLSPHDSINEFKPQDQRWDNDLLTLGVFCLGATSKAVNESGGIYPETYLLWLGKSVTVTTKAINETIENSTHLRQKWQEKTKMTTLNPRIIITGPGCQAIEPDKEKRYAVLDFTAIRRATWEGDLKNRLWGHIRAQWRLTALSPFKTSGALNPGSKVFRGRDKELAFVEQRCRQASVLIIGSRRVGKTSLLNQVYYWAEQQSDLCAIFLDLQGICDYQEFLGKLKNAEIKGLNEQSQRLLKTINTSDKTALSRLTRAISKQKKLALFLFNEVDGLAAHDTALIKNWRSLNDLGLAHFIMTGYSVIGQLGHPAADFFHFTEGTYYDGKAIALTSLSEEAARLILDLLEDSDLKLGWRTEDEKQQAYQLLLSHSYRIPWVLQTYGRLLVELLEEQRRTVLSLDDVTSLLQNKGRIVWNYIENIDFSKLDSDVSSNENQDLTKKVSNAQRDGLLVILYALVRQKYALHDANALKDETIQQRNALDLAFTDAEVNTLVEKTIAELPLVDKEKEKWTEWYQNLNLTKTLRLLTLTLILEPDPVIVNRYAFLLHIFPVEVYKQYGKNDPYLENLLTETISNFLHLI